MLSLKLVKAGFQFELLALLGDRVLRLLGCLQLLLTLANVGIHPSKDHTHYLEILRTGEVQRTLTFHSPAAGVVVEKNVEEGQAVEAGQTLYRIADLSAVWVEAELREADAGAVRVG